MTLQLFPLWVFVDVVVVVVDRITNNDVVVIVFVFFYCCSPLAHLHLMHFKCFHMCLVENSYIAQRIHVCKREIMQNCFGIKCGDSDKVSPSSEQVHLVVLNSKKYFFGKYVSDNLLGQWKNEDRLSIDIFFFFCQFAIEDVNWIKQNAHILVQMENRIRTNFTLYHLSTFIVNGWLFRLLFVTRLFVGRLFCA